MKPTYSDAGKLAWYPEELSLHSPRSSYYFLKILHKLLEMQNSYNPQHLVPNNH